LLSRRFVAVVGGRRVRVGRVVTRALILPVVDGGAEDRGSTLVGGIGSVMEGVRGDEIVSVLVG